MSEASRPVRAETLAAGRENVDISLDGATVSFHFRFIDGYEAMVVYEDLVERFRLGQRITLTLDGKGPSETVE